jgi:hypothetical protein
MRRFVGIFISILAVCALAYSCSRGPKTIPQKKMKEIYKEMFLADQWLQDNPGKRAKADTTWFYKPILEKYGYTMVDYYHTVAVYLEDPKRYADMMESITTTLSAESEALVAEGRKEEKIVSDLEMKAKWKGGYFSDDMDVVTKGYEMIKDADSVWHPRPIEDDTLFSGPEMIIKDLPEPAADSVEAESSLKDDLSHASGEVPDEEPKPEKDKSPLAKALPISKTIKK